MDGQVRITVRRQVIFIGNLIFVSLWRLALPLHLDAFVSVCFVSSHSLLIFSDSMKFLCRYYNTIHVEVPALLLLWHAVTEDQLAKVEHPSTSSRIGLLEHDR